MIDDVKLTELPGPLWPQEECEEFARRSFLEILRKASPIKTDLIEVSYVDGEDSTRWRLTLSPVLIQTTANVIQQGSLQPAANASVNISYDSSSSIPKTIKLGITNDGQLEVEEITEGKKKPVCKFRKGAASNILKPSIAIFDAATVLHDINLCQTEIPLAVAA